MAFLTVSIVGIQKISINDNPVRWFKAEHPIRVADEVLNQHFAGTYDAQLVLTVDSAAIEQKLLDFLADKPTYPVLLSLVLDINEQSEPLGSLLEEYYTKIEEVMFEASEEEQAQLEPVLVKLDAATQALSAFLEPKNIAYLEGLQQSMDHTDFVGKSNSLVDVVKVVNRELLSGNEADFAIPSSSQAIAQVLLQYQSSHRPQDLWHFVTKDYSSTALWIQMRSGDNQSMEQVIQWTNNYLGANPLPTGISARWAGKTYLNKVWQDEMVAGMMTSLLSAFVVVLLMMVILFRNLWLGLLAMLPLTITISMMYGFIGWIGKDYDMPMAVLSALTLGLSVDFAIHYLERARQMYKENNSIEQTLQMMRQEPQRAISRNAIVIAVGFTPLILAPLMPYVTVGFFLAAIMTLSAITTLWLLPVFVAKFGHKIL